jgi:hypothetical protein
MHDGGQAAGAVPVADRPLRRALEIERTARAKAERALRARDETLAVVAHDGRLSGELALAIGAPHMVRSGRERNRMAP